MREYIVPLCRTCHRDVGQHPNKCPKPIKLTDKETANGNSIEFTLKNGKILSAKTSGPFFSDGWIIEQKNTAIYYNEGWEIEVELNEFGYKN